MRAALVALFSFLALAASLPCHAKTEQEMREAIEAVLVDPHSRESLDWWRGLGGDAPALIISMYQSEPVLGRRLHLLKGLGAFNDPVAADFLKQQASDTQDSVVRNQAVRALGNAQGAAAADFVARFLDNADAQTRLAAGETLRAMQDPHAQDLYSRYLSQEKAPWLVAKLKGEAPPKPLSLMPVSSSEDRISPDFTGTWKGFLVAPKPDSAGGMMSEPAILVLSVEGASDVKGSLALKSKGKARSLGLSKASGRATRISGTFTAPPAAPAKPGQPAPPPEEIAFEAEILPQSSSGKLLQLRDTRSGAILVVRKEP